METVNKIKEMLLPEIKTKKILMSDESLNKTEEIFKKFMIGGYSIRTLGKMYGIPWTTLRDRFRRLYGNDYTYRSGGEGSIHNVIAEYLEDESLTEEEREKIRDWYEENQDYLLTLSYQDQKKDKTKLYTENKLYRDSAYQISLQEDISSRVTKDERYSPQIEDQ